MHFLKNILCVIGSFSLSLAWGHEHSVFSRADSLFSSMSEAEKVSQLIWTKASPNTDPIINRFGGIYYTQPLDHTPFPSNNVIAVQLDERLTPVLDDTNQLPDLFTLASIQKSDLLNTYFHFLKSYAKGKGIDYLVLPQQTQLHIRIDEVIQQMNAHDPDFFKLSNGLDFEFDKQRKKINEHLESSTFWVIAPENAEILEKKIQKHAFDILEETSIEDRIKQHLINTLYASPTEQIDFPNRLAIEIGRESIISLSKEPILPLTADTICFLTNEPYGPMANMLRNYSFVITEYSDIASSNSVIVIDNDALIPNHISLSNRIVVFTGTSDHLNKIKEQVDAALVYHLENEIYHYLIPQQLFGSHGTTGIIPYQDQMFLGFNHQPLSGLQILGYAPPEMTGLDDMAKQRIQEIIQEAISTGSTPGAQLAVAVDGSIIMEEAYGFLTYDSLIPVEKSTLYDLASVTKVTATLLATMKLYEEGRIHLDSTVAHYLPDYIHSNKNNITLRALLSHNAGLRSYIPFWQKALNSEFGETFYYQNEEDKLNDKRSYGIKPSDMLLDSLKSWIVQSPLLNFDSIPGYRYSDIGFMILHDVVEAIIQKPMNLYLQEEFYDPMGLRRTTFKPMEKGFELFEIAPTEHDYYFRDELVWGVVHDRNAAILGGVAGHAGLFSNAHELLVLLQTILQDGKYAGKKYLESGTVAYFNQQFFNNNRRALGWDKPDKAIGNTSILSSDLSFGHTGFTGTMVWVDPAYDLIFVFLSNRIHPNSNNYQLIRRNIRTRIQDVVYEALLAKWMN